MTRPVDLESRAALLERVSAYVVEHGLAGLSLRPLAKAVGSSPRMLLYHFGSKEAIVTAVLRGIRERQLAMFDQLRRSELSTPAAICRAAWAYMRTPAILPMLRLFFETYALALREPQRFPGFLTGAVEDWLQFLSDPACKGRTATSARRRDDHPCRISRLHARLRRNARRGTDRRRARCVGASTRGLFRKGRKPCRTSLRRR
ncbi:MAG TPA: TetR/AcrR family transcriptional regulator [Candidatus Acidoferrales bacterium]|nr:TetR/AcrR family transcriptional regulator [Candidatus Acidoferrales bacterium]